jgi:simple sugar transport system permease protein
MLELFVMCVQAATPIWLVALGGLLAQRSGVMHLGLEGLMLLGAFVVVTTTIATGSPALGILAAIGVNLVVSLLFWLLISVLRTDVIITGLALSLTSAAATTFALVTLYGSQAAINSPVGLPRPVPVEGPLGAFTVLTYAAVLLTGVLWFLLGRTRWGLAVSAAGSDPFAARSAGVDVDRTRLLALLAAGAFAALAGAELSLANVQIFAENMTQGRGYLAFIAVLLGAVRPLGVAAAALFFGLADGLAIRSQLSLNAVVPVQFVQMLPYVCTIVALVIASTLMQRRRRSASTISEAGAPR